LLIVTYNDIALGSSAAVPDRLSLKSHFPFRPLLFAPFFARAKLVRSLPDKS